MARRRSFAAPIDTALTKPIPAEINHGRWIVRCPYCSGAELADTADPRFFCLSCLNEEAGGKWLPVQFPANREELEKALLERKQVETRSWLPHESLTDLLAQTLEREEL